MGPRFQDPASLSTSEGFSLIQDAVSRLSNCPDVDKVVAAIRSGLEEWLGADASIISLTTEGERELTTLLLFGASEETETYLQTPITLEEGTPAAAVISSGEPLYWESLGDRDRDYPKYASFPSECSSWAILPLTGHDRTFGTLSIGWRTPQRFESQLSTLLRLLAQQCALAIDRARIQEAERADRETLELMSEGTRLMVSDLNPDHVVERLVHLAVPRLAPWCAVYVSEGEHLRRVAIEVADRGELARNLRGLDAVAIGSESPLAVCYRTGTAQLVPIVRRNHMSALYTEEQIGEIERFGRDWTALVVPIRASGQTIGVMSLVSRAWRGAPPDQVWHAAEGLAGRAGVALANARRYGRERSTAALLSATLLPGRLPPLPGYETAARYIPAQGRVAGDWFDVFQVPPGQVLVGVGDVGGHDVRAATLMIQLRSAARGLALGGSSPDGILSGLTPLLLSEDAEVGFATALYGFLEPSSGNFDWSSAGHLPPLAFGDDGARWLDLATCPPLGLERPTNGGREHRHLLDPGQGVLLVTDGVVERRDHDILARLEEFRTFVADHRSRGLDATVDAVVRQYCQASEDDCCIVAIRRSPSTPESDR